MNTVVMGLDENQECDSINLSENKNKQPNAGMVKQESPEADDLPLQYEKPKNVSTDDQLASTSLNTFDADVIKSEPVMQDCWLENDQKMAVKEELLHEELDIKSEDEATQDICVDEKHNMGNKLHKNMKHASTVKPFQCNICDKSYSSKGNFKAHLRIHTGERPFKCNICEYSCRKKNDLKVHLRIHSGEKPFKCNICDYSCCDNSTLKSHLRIHTGEKPFKCTICDYSFGQRGHLSTHLRTHTGEKPFKCNFCDHCCVQNGTLKRHLRTHTRENI